MREFSGTETQPASVNFARLFETQAKATPDAIAVVCGNAQLTYTALNASANQLARELVRLGVDRDALVGICLERSPELIVAILGTLKAGAAYVPLDPKYPQERIGFMVRDARPTVLLTQAGLLGKLASSGAPAAGVTVALEARQPAILCLDSDADLINQNSVEDPGIDVSPENLAYVIYTSGSTGNPKGARITHRGLANYLQWAVEAYEVAAGIGAPVHSSISFDLTVTSLFTPLMVGRSVFLLPDGVESLAEALLQRTNYSLLKITPAHLRALAELLPADQVAGRVRALVIGGEALHYQSLEFWREHAPATRIINEYGPTETVVGCCVHEVLAGDPHAGPVPIGRAIANTDLCILDENFNPVADGELGELFIGGDGVARGYLNRDGLTRERFVTTPFSGSARFYRSGDLVRQCADGSLEYIGRADDQVKIRGYRIELGEIEAALKQHASVLDCAVVVCESGPDDKRDKRLIAFIQSDESVPGDEASLRESLEEKLPEYMVPAAFVPRPSLPLTVNGKIDRQALASEAPGLTPNGDFMPPRTAAEETLAGIWSDVLKVDRVSINDNFFDLGGDSILGTLILARAARAGLKLSPVQLFEHQTVAELAAVARGA